MEQFLILNTVHRFMRTKRRSHRISKSFDNSPDVGTFNAKIAFTLKHWIQCLDTQSKADYSTGSKCIR